MDSGRLQPALYGGIVIGVLSALPFVKAGNCCCCLWVIAGGMLAVYLRQQNTPFSVTSAEGALVGLLAGIIGAIIGSLLSVPIEMMMGPFQQQMFQRFIESRPDLPPEVRDAAQRFGAQATGPVAFAFNLVMNVFLDTIFGLLGGLLGVAVFKKNVPPPPPGTVEVLPPE